jgi:uncharacterized phage-associated protein
MAKPKALEKFYEVFFDNLDENTLLTPVEQQQLVRYRYALHVLLERPWLTDSKLVDDLMNEWNISKSQAYRDIQNMEMLKGRVQNTAREFQQYKINSALNRALEIAIDANDAETISKVCNVIGKYNRLDKEDTPKIPFDEIIPRQIEYINDPAILGVKLSEAVKKNPQAFVESLINKYTKSINLDNYVDYQETDEDGN